LSATDFEREKENDWKSRSFCEGKKLIAEKSLQKFENNAGESLKLLVNEDEELIGFESCSHVSQPRGGFLIL
jgi:hypothetical protein